MIPSLRFATPAVLALAVMAGCQSTHPATSTATANPAISERPTVDVTAADLFSWGPDGGATQQLEFYDELEKRAITSQDDAIHAVLLLDNGSSASTYANRLTVAKARGLLDMSYDRPPQEAVTVGEVSVMVARSLHLKSADSPTAAVEEFKQVGVIPESASMYHGLTGAQLLAFLGAVQDEFGDRLAARAGQHAGPMVASVEAAAASRTASGTAQTKEQFDDFIGLPAAAPAAQPAAQRAAPVIIDSSAPRAMSEPLPNVPATSAPAKPAARVVAPVVAVQAAPPPAPAAAKPVPTAKVEVGTPQLGEWVGGRALKRKSVEPDAKATSTPR